MAIMREETKPSTKVTNDYGRDDSDPKVKAPRDDQPIKDRGTLDKVNYGDGARAV
jgi:hypothetical protein